MSVKPMRLRVLLPFKVFVEHDDVLRIIVETRCGLLGLLPRRLDCAAELVPGILMYETAATGRVYLAVNAGVLVKAGDLVLVSVRDAMMGMTLDELHLAVMREYGRWDSKQGGERAVLAKLEGELMRRFVGLHHE